MSPKGCKSAPKDIGNVHLNHDFWEATVKIDGKVVRGPSRTHKHEADADLLQAKQKVTQEQMRTFLMDLRSQAQVVTGIASVSQGTALLAGTGPGGGNAEATPDCVPQSLTGSSSGFHGTAQPVAGTEPEKETQKPYQRACPSP